MRESDGYLKFHAPRFQTLLDLVRSYHQPGTRVLDIGPSRLTDMLAESLQISVDTLGFAPDADTPYGKHYEFDLNECQRINKWRRDIGPYDIVVVAEVIDRLHASPNLVLSYLNTITARGGRVILQTANAVALHKRVRKLLGKNPCERVKGTAQDPGPIREYTKEEMAGFAEHASFRADSFHYGNYYDFRYSLDKPDSFTYRPHYGLLNRLFSLCPVSLKPGLTLVLSKEGEIVFSVATPA